MVIPDHRDLCGSFRQSSFDGRVHFAVAQDNTWDPGRLYDCPAGFRWVSTEEASALFPANVDSGGPLAFTYYDQCGWTAYTWGGVYRSGFRFSDSAITGAVKTAAHSDAYRPDLGDYRLNDFAGIVCVVEGYLGIGAPTLNQELWRSDGTVEGTRRIEDVEPGATGSQPAYLTSFGGYVYFAATTSLDGRELWRSVGDGETHASIVSFNAPRGIYPQSGSSDPQYLTSSSLLLFFAATDPVIGKVHSILSSYFIRLRKGTLDLGSYWDSELR